MKFKKLSTKDWMSSTLGLSQIATRPKSKSVVESTCFSCMKPREIVFAELIRSTNTQLQYGLEGYHCPECFRQSKQFKNESRLKSLKAKSKIVDSCRKKSKELWKDEKYANKCKKASRLKAKSNNFKKKCSDSMKLKFATDKDYVNKVKVSRQNYYSHPSQNPRTMSQEEFVKRCVSVHGDKYDYSLVEYVNQRTKVKVICSKHGIFETRPNGHTRSKNGCPSCNTEKLVSIPENDLFKWVSSLYSGPIEQSNRSVFAGLEIDIFFPELNFGIEYHGAYFHSFNSRESTYHRNYHSMKSTLAFNNSINLMQFVDLDFANKKPIAESMIRHKLNLSEKIFARKCTVELLNDVPTIRKFFKNNHYHGYQYAENNVALVYNNEIICILAIKKRKDYYEIARFATALNNCVIGGFSKLLKSARKLLGPVVFFTYVDRMFTTSENCYSGCGMNFLGITRPGYRYWKSNVLFNRIKFQKHKLSNVLENYDPLLTEAENMFANGYRRLWDAGNLRYEMKL